MEKRGFVIARHLAQGIDRRLADARVGVFQCGEQRRSGSPCIRSDAAQNGGAPLTDFRGIVGKALNGAGNGIFRQDALTGPFGQDESGRGCGNALLVERLQELRNEGIVRAFHQLPGNVHGTLFISLPDKVLEQLSWRVVHL